MSTKIFKILPVGVVLIVLTIALSLLLNTKNSQPETQQVVRTPIGESQDVMQLKNFEEYMWFTDLIVIGTVVKQEESYNVEGNITDAHKISQPVTPAKIELNQSILGDVEETFTLLQHGTPSDNNGEESFVKPGEQYIFFLMPKSTFGGYWEFNKWEIKDNGKVKVTLPTNIDEIKGFESNELEEVLKTVEKGLKNKTKPEILK